VQPLVDVSSVLRFYRTGVMSGVNESGQCIGLESLRDERGGEYTVEGGQE
jgi:hypothetical protein